MMVDISWFDQIKDDPGEIAEILWLAERNGAIRVANDGHVWVGRACIGRVKLNE